MADLVQRGEGVQRQADVLLRAVGGSDVLLRMPGMAAQGDDGEQMGLATPMFNDVVLGPVAFHKAASAKKLMVSARAVNAVAGGQGIASGEALFAAAVGVVVGGVVYAIADSHCAEAMGETYCWWLTLTAPVR